MHYAYDFNYSMHLDAIPTLQSVHNDQRRNRFTLVVRQFVQADAIQAREIKQFAYLLIRQNLFNKIGNLLVQLGQIQLQFVPKTLQSMERLQSLREELCESIRQLHVILGRDNQHYLNIIILFLSTLLTRILAEKHSRNIQQSVIFHLLFWEIKGQYSTNSIFDSLMSDIFIKKKIVAFVQWKQEKTQNQLLKNSVTFKQIRQSINNGKNQSVTSFQRALNKENHHLNTQFKPNILSFKKQVAKKNAKLQY